MQAESLLMRSFALLVVATLAYTGPAAAAEVTQMRSRHGDNTISFVWNDETKEVVHAESSRRLRAHQRVELLTRLVERSGQIVMRAVLKNVSRSHVFRVDGYLVHKIFENGVVIQRIKTQEFHLRLRPTDKILGRFEYTLPSGNYAARTDFKRL